MQKPKKILSSKVVHKNPYYQLREDKLVHKNGKQGKYYTVVVDPFVIICALDSKRKQVYLIKTWRYPLNRYHWELPAGRLDKNETPLMAAKRELKEEVGIEAKKWKPLGWFYLAPGISNQRGYVFLAERLEQIKNSQLDEEIVEVKLLPLTRLSKMIKDKKLTGAPGLIAAQKLFDHLKQR